MSSILVGKPRTASHTFNSAFESRIHFCLDYPDLGPRARETVWNNSIAKAKQNTGLQIDLSNANVEGLADLDLNGWQIKNIMSVSQAVAMKRGQVLREETVRTTVKLTQISIRRK